jgi:hypothetical protein
MGRKGAQRQGRARGEARRLKDGAPLAARFFGKTHSPISPSNRDDHISLVFVSDEEDFPFSSQAQPSHKF